jgi:hypothetical protein
MDGIVKQLDQFGGIVIECSCVTECMKANQDLTQAPYSSNTQCGRVKQCQLSVNHGDRCLAYPQDSSSWLIDSDPTKIKGIPTQDGVIR